MFERRLHRTYRGLRAIGESVRRRLTPAGTLVLLAIAGTGLVGADTNLTLLHQAFAFLVALAALAWGFSRLRPPRLELVREAPRFAEAGRTALCRVEIRNPGRRRLRGLQVREREPDPRPSLEDFLSRREPGARTRNWFDRTFAYHRWRWLLHRNRRFEARAVAVPDLPPGARVTLDLPFDAQRRGPVHLEALEVLRPDPFGLFLGIRPFAAPARVMVLPPRYPAAPPGLPGSARHQPGGVALSSSVGESEEFFALREYRPGDPRRKIHWRSWARVGRPVVREGQDEFFVRHALVLDTFAPPELDVAFEEAVKVASSYACTMPAQDALLDLLFAGERAFCFTAGRGLAHTDHLLEILASVERCEDRPFGVLADLVRRHAQQVSGCVLVLLDWDEPRQALVADLERLGVPLRVCLVREAGVAAAPDPGPLRGDPGRLRVLECGRIAEGLARP